MKINTKHFLSVLAVCSMGFFVSCSEDEPAPIVASDTEKVSETGVDGGAYAGFYVLNEGNMGSNKCTLDYFDYATATYMRNIYAEQNPGVALELGDTGNDIAVNGGRLYIVLNGSHKVEVLDARTAKRIGQVDISSPRYLAFDGDNVYVSSFVGGEGSGKDEHGTVVRFDARSLAVTGKVSVGLQPEEMVVTGGKLYVANSGQLSSKYDNTISVIDLASFKMERSIEAAINMHHLVLDRFGNMWASSRGNYQDISACLMHITKDSDGAFGKINTIDFPCTNLALGSKNLYFYGTTYDASWNATITYDYLEPTATGYTDFEKNFITDGTEKTIMAPYALAVQPSTGAFVITDARNYTSSGELRYYSPAGKLQWTVKTGDIPGHIAFLPK